MANNVKMKNHVLLMLEEDQPPSVLPISVNGTLLSESEKAVKWRIRARLQEQLSQRPIKSRLLSISMKSAPWAVAAVSLLFLLTLVISRKDERPELMSVTLTQLGTTRSVDLENEKLSLQAPFTLSRGSNLVIKGDRLATKPPMGRNNLKITEGRFTVTYNRDHLDPAMEFRFATYRVRVIVTVFGVEFKGALLSVAVSEGKIHVIDQNNLTYEVVKGQLRTFDVVQKKHIADHTLTKNDFHRMFQPEFGRQKKLRNEVKIRMREIDEQEAARIEAQK